MTRYYIEPKDEIYVKDYRYLPFAKDMSKNTGENISIRSSDKYSQIPPNHAKKSATDKLKNTSPQNNSGTVENNTEKRLDFI